MLDKMDLQEWVIRKVRETEDAKKSASDAMKLVLSGKLGAYAEFGKKIMELK